MITPGNAAKIVEFMERYNKHFTELRSFLELKQVKTLADDLVWLHDSLAQEQKFVMAGNSLESKRLELLEEIGCADYTSAKLLEVLPEEYKGRFKLECVNLEKSVDRIKQLNHEILEVIEKKLDVADSQMRSMHKVAGAAGFYDGAGSKVRLTNPEDEIIGNM